MPRMFQAWRRPAVARLVIMAVVQAGALILAEIALYQFHNPSPALAACVALVACAGMLGVYALLVRLFEARWPGEIAFRPGWIALGLALGFGLFCAVYAILTLMGVASWMGFQGFSGVVPVLLAAAVAGVGEELLLRGVLFRVLEDSLGTALAIAASAIVFGLLHAANPSATAVSTLAIALEAGVMLAAAYAWSRTLWLPIALHFAWNFTEGGVFGAAVSGGRGDGSLFAVRLAPSASPLITGGAFGPEASLVAVAVCVALGAVFILADRRSGNWRPPTFRMLLA